MGGEVFELYSHNIIDCIKSLFRDPEFTSYLLLVPERHYEDATLTNRMVHEMNTGRWWWDTQVRLTIVHSANVLMACYSGSRKLLKTIHQARPLCPSLYHLTRLSLPILAEKRRIQFTLPLETCPKKSDESLRIILTPSLHIFPPLSSSMYLTSLPVGTC